MVECIAVQVGAQEIFEKLLLLAAHLALGLFLSGTLGLLLYIVTLPVAQSIWRVADIDFALLGVLTIGVGAGVGCFLGWLNRNLGGRTLALVLLLTLAVALLAAWGGLHESRDVIKHVGKPGIPALTGMVVGAMLGGNALNLLLWIVWTARNPRL